MQLKKIVSIQSGYQARRKVRPAIGQDASDAVSFIQIKDVDAEKGLNLNAVDRIKVEGDLERYMVCQGDVLFLAREPRQFAVVIDQELQQTIVTSYFYILRIQIDYVTPWYLAWFLNEPKFQERWKREMRATQSQVVLKSTFSNIDIEVPSRKTQTKIVELDRLRRREAHLLQSIQQKRRQLVQAITTRAAISSSEL